MQIRAFAHRLLRSGLWMIESLDRFTGPTNELPSVEASENETAIVAIKRPGENLTLSWLPCDGDSALAQILGDSPADDCLSDRGCGRMLIMYRGYKNWFFNTNVSGNFPDHRRPGEFVNGTVVFAASIERRSREGFIEEVYVDLDHEDINLIEELLEQPALGEDPTR